MFSVYSLNPSNYSLQVVLSPHVTIGYPVCHVSGDVTATHCLPRSLRPAPSIYILLNRYTLCQVSWV